MNKKILFLIPSLRYNDGIACAIMNYYMSLIERGWIVDFMLVEEGENAWNQQISGRGKIYRLPNVNKYNPVIKKNYRNYYKKRRLQYCTCKYSGSCCINDTYSRSKK